MACKRKIKQQNKKQNKNKMIQIGRHEVEKR